MQFFVLPNFCPPCMLLVHDTYGVLILWVCFLFIKKIGDIIAPKLSIIFYRLISLGSFLECSRSAIVTAIPIGAPSPHREDYQPISIDPILSKILRCMRSLFLTNSPVFARNEFICLLRSLLIGKAFAALMHCLTYLITFRSSYMQGWSLISWSNILGSLKYQGVEPPNLQGVSCRPRLYVLPYTSFDTGTLVMFKGAVNSWSLP